MKTKIDFSQLGGLYFTQDVLNILQSGYADLWDTIGAFVGGFLILSGCTVVGNNVSAGYVTVTTNNLTEILPFAGGTNTGYCYVQVTTTNRQFEDGTQKGIIATKQVVFTQSGTTGAFSFTNFQTLPYLSTNLQEALDAVQSLLQNLINIEPAVIIGGCAISAVNTGASTLAIAAGTVMIDGQLVAAQPYAGAYPVYLPSSGIYTTVQPGAGDYVTFNPYTSSYYADVLFRAQHQTGDVVMNTQAATLANFDLGTGLGKWRWQGWKLSQVLRGRVPLGYDPRTGDPGDGIWDAVYNTPGSQLGQKTHVQTEEEMAEHTHEEIVQQAVNNGGTNPAGYLNTTGGNVGSGVQTGSAGGSVAMDWRQASTVIIFIEKI